VNGAALALALSSLALLLFPLIRPYFPFDPTAPAETLAGAAPAVTSARWLIAHYLALIGFILLLAALPALGAAFRCGRAAWLSAVGVALILPTLGVELYALPAIGRLHQEGHAVVAGLVGLIYLGAAVLVMLLGLVFLAIGAIRVAVAMVRHGAVPRWAAVAYAAGLALWCPILPPPVRIVDGLLIGLGGIALARALGRTAAAAAFAPQEGIRPG
jgi:hypothetical protein